MQNYHKAFGGLGRQIPSLLVNEDGLAQIKSQLPSFNRGLRNREAQTMQRAKKSKVYIYLGVKHSFWSRMNKNSNTFIHRQGKEIIVSRTGRGQVHFFLFIPAKQLHWEGKALDSERLMRASADTVICAEAAKSSLRLGLKRSGSMPELLTTSILPSICL